MVDKFKIINFEDVKNITADEYFSGEKFAVDMFDAKYSHTKENGGKETPADVFLRIAYELSRFEKSKKNQDHYCDMWFSLLWIGWFRPGGSIMNGIGNGSRVSTCNCTTIPLSGDSLEDISKCDYNVMKCAAFRQGIGVDVSKLRPRGAKVNNAANESTGIVPWVCKIVDNGKYVGQSGRMPALLISLKIDHPDIEEFITAKTKQGVIENANISVQITNDFMEAVANDDDWQLSFNFSNNSEYRIFTKTAKAKKLFSLISATAWASAEPGIQYIDLMKKGSMVQCVADVTGDKKYEIISTNACCITNNTNIFLDTGIEKLQNVLNEKNLIGITDEGTTLIDEILPQGKKEVYNVITKEGVTLDCTFDHKIKKVDGQLVESGMLKKGDLLAIPNGVFQPNIIDSKDLDIGFLLGLMVGDGYLASQHKTFGLSISKEEMEIYEYLKEFFVTHFNYDIESRIYDKPGCVQLVCSSADLYGRLLKMGLKACNSDEKCVPISIYNNKSKMIGFLRGIFQSDGCVNYKSPKSYYVGLDSTSLVLVEQVQELLLYFGIKSTVYKNRRNGKTNTLLPDGNGGQKKYNVKEMHSLRIVNKEIRTFSKVVGFLPDTYKDDRLKTVCSKRLKNSKRYLTFDKIKYKGIENVYDLINSRTGTFTANGIVISNSEKPLPAFGVCNLLSINMEMFSIDQDEYRKELEFIIPYLVRLSDNVVTYELSNNLSPVPEQRDMVKSLREIGMGATNIHGWFLKQDLAYDSDKATDVAEDFFKHYAYNVFKSSVELGKEKGNSTAFDMVKDKKRFMNSIYFKNIVTEFFNGDASKIETMRNMAHMSIAPTGSLSNSFPTPCISSGIEPVIGLYYWRRTRAVENGIYVHYFVIPNRLKEYILNKIDKNSEDYLTFMQFSGSERDDDGAIGIRLVEIINKYIPKGFFKFAHEIDYKRKINLMSSVYRWIDAAVSCTYNLPNTSTPEDVEVIYIEAYKKGVRAVSVYVDGSREGVLIFDDPITNKSKFERKTTICNSRPESIQINCAPKRHEVLECNIHQISIKGEMWTVLVGMFYGLPFEIFCGQAEDLYIPKSCKKGKIIKRGNGKYSLEVMIRKSPVEYKDLAQVLMTDEERSLTRLLSLNLRHGVPLQFISEQLKKSNGGITTFSTAISRVLSHYIKNTDYMYKDGEKKCPECGKSTMIFKGGCFECIGCGYSKCG